MSPPPYLSFEHVTYAHGSHTVLRDLSFSLQERRVGIIGPNGSGKSSLLRLAHGLVQPESGKVTTVRKCTVRQRREIPSQVGFLFQNPDRQILFPTVGEEIAFGFEEKGMSRRDALREALAWMSRFQRAEWFDRSIQDMSGGQKQLVCLISVLALEPSLILLDEPFASLDLHTRLGFAHQLESLQQSIIMASHDLDFLANFDRILWLEDGVIHADGPPPEVLPAYKTSALQHAVRFA